MLRWISLIVFLFVVHQNCFAQRWVNSNTVRIDEIIDENIKDVRRHIVAFGFDPMKLPNISDTFYVSIWFTNHTIKLNLTNGVMTGGKEMHRGGGFYVQFLKGKVRIQGKVHYDEIYGKFNFSYSSWAYSDQGVMNTTIKNVTAIIRVDFRLDTFTLVDPKFKILSYESVRVKMTSDAYLSVATNLVANIAIPYYKEEVVKIAESTALIVTKRALRNINKNMNQWIANTINSLLMGRGQYLNNINNGR